MDTNHAYRVLANYLHAMAREAASQGKCFGRKVPLALVCNMADPEEHRLLVEMNRLGLIELHRADLMSAWDAQFGREVMDQSELKHSVSEWHAVSLRDDDAKELGLF